MKLVVKQKSSEFIPGKGTIEYQVLCDVVSAKGQKMAASPVIIYPDNATEYEFWNLGKEFPISELEKI